jgi:hypothetical protein
LEFEIGIAVSDALVELPRLSNSPTKTLTHAICALFSCGRWYDHLTSVRSGCSRSKATRLPPAGSLNLSFRRAFHEQLDGL